VCREKGLILIHPTAVIDPSAQIAEGVQIGPYCVIGADVCIDEGCILDSHVCVHGPTQIGKNNRFFPFGSIGADPQDKKYDGEPTRLVIGDNNMFRENVTINRGTAQDLGETRVGNDNWVMAAVHIAHDCIVGDHTILANAVALAGHVKVDDWSILGGYSLVHQFCHIGAHTFCGMGSVINQDVPDFVVVSGNLAKARGVNSEGLKRRGFSPEQIRLVKNAYKAIYLKKYSLNEAIDYLNQINDSKTLSALIQFLTHSSRGIVR
jgi:UDP-N-acetylglucosamine acyltransferase